MKRNLIYTTHFISRQPPNTMSDFLLALALGIPLDSILIVIP